MFKKEMWKGGHIKNKGKVRGSEVRWCRDVLIGNSEIVSELDRIGVELFRGPDVAGNYSDFPKS